MRENSQINTVKMRLLRQTTISKRLDMFQKLLHLSYLLQCKNGKFTKSAEPYLVSSRRFGYLVEVLEYLTNTSFVNQLFIKLLYAMVYEDKDWKKRCLLLLCICIYAHSLCVYIIYIYIYLYIKIDR